VLIGLPSLDARLEDPALAALRQRVAVHCRMTPLTHKETRQYLHHRVTAAGGDGAKVFPRRTCNEIHERTNGVPRAINALAAEAMRRARESGNAVVSSDQVRAAAIALWGETGRCTPAPSASAAIVEAEGDDPEMAAEPVSEPASAAVEQTTAVAVETPATVTSNPEPEPSVITTAPPAPSAVVSEADEAPTPVAEPDATGDPGIDRTEASPTVAVEPAPEPAPPRVETEAEREWVARFMADGPPRIGVRARFTLDPEEAALSTATLRDEESPLFLQDEVDAAPGRRARPRGAPHAAAPSRRLGAGALSMIVIASIAIGAFAAVVILPRSAELRRRVESIAASVGERLRPKSEPSPSARSGVQVAAMSPALEFFPDSADAEPTAVAKTSTPPETTVAARVTPPARGASPIASPSTSARSEIEFEDDAAENGKRFTLEVGTFYDPDHAAAERDRLTRASGLQGWVVDATTYEGYRIVLGVFRSTTRAEAAAKRLLARDVVFKGRVVPLPPRQARH
jgi:hypothetical protein